MRELSPARAQEIGGRALARVLRDHTYAQRALDVERAWAQLRDKRREAAA